MHYQNTLACGVMPEVTADSNHSLAKILLELPSVPTVLGQGMPCKTSHLCGKGRGGSVWRCAVDRVVVYLWCVVVYLLWDPRHDNFWGAGSTYYMAPLTTDNFKKAVL